MKDMTIFCCGLIPLTGLLLGFASAAHSAETLRISPAQSDPGGFLVHTVQSPYQSGTTKIKVLLPSPLEKDRRYRVLYILPVEAQDGSHFGDGLLEAVRTHVADKHRLICVLPTFSQLPWYADHPTKADVRQETYFVKVVVPFVDRAYPVEPGRKGRLLVGFSKSGWGAFSLLLRQPELFDKAAAWDAPLMMDRPEKFGTPAIFATQENFQKYQVSSLLRQQASNLAGEVRLVHFGYGNFREEHESAHRLMVELKIPHGYRDGPKREHTWHSGWLPEAVEMLVEKTR